MSNSITKELVVAATLEHTFDVFTAKMGTWWPKEHHIGKTPFVDIVVEPRLEGRWYEKCEDGSECQWGKVLAWEPPRRLVLAWQLNAAFTYDPALVTEVELVFTSLGPKSTKVAFEHRYLDRFGADKVLMIVPMMTEGWGMILGQAVAAATR